MSDAPKKKLSLEELEAKAKVGKAPLSKRGRKPGKPAAPPKPKGKSFTQVKEEKKQLAKAHKSELKGLKQRAGNVQKREAPSNYRITRGEYPCLCGCGRTCSKLFRKGHVSKFLKLLDTKGLKYTTNRLKEAHARLQKQKRAA